MIGGDSKALSQQRYSKFAGGYVTSKAGADSLFNALVEAEKGGVTESTYTDINGRYEHNVRTGEWHLRASLTGYITSAPETLTLT